ncbi:hypothetical protein KIPB_000068 [Kipferlia bialata]|uniref:Uncharacterized protein n=1 Tax=Kipferlia bialata TaxID=797122 RepID=A0A9K3GE26_9EUKA|nr:hypothetical protein KIPB_000068 [Kipferlia bialata]|eukprot:g68.t1
MFAVYQKSTLRVNPFHLFMYGHRSNYPKDFESTTAVIRQSHTEWSREVPETLYDFSTLNIEPNPLMYDVYPSMRRRCERLRTTVLAMPLKTEEELASELEAGLDVVLCRLSDITEEASPLLHRLWYAINATRTTTRVVVALGPPMETMESRYRGLPLSLALHMPWRLLDEGVPIDKAFDRNGKPCMALTYFDEPHAGLMETKQEARERREKLRTSVLQDVMGLHYSQDGRPITSDENALFRLNHAEAEGKIFPVHFSEAEIEAAIQSWKGLDHVSYGKQVLPAAERVADILCGKKTYSATPGRQSLVAVLFMTDVEAKTGQRAGVLCVNLSGNLTNHQLGYLIALKGPSMKTLPPKECMVVYLPDIGETRAKSFCDSLKELHLDVLAVSTVKTPSALKKALANAPHVLVASHHHVKATPQSKAGKMHATMWRALVKEGVRVRAFMCLGKDIGPTNETTLRNMYENLAGFVLVNYSDKTEGGPVADTLQCIPLRSYFEEVWLRLCSVDE